MYTWKTTVSEIAIATILLTFSIPAVAQDFGETVSAAMDAIRDARDRNSAPAEVKAIFGKASDAEDDGCLVFCGFYLGMTEADAISLAAHYGLKDSQWAWSATPSTKQVYKLSFTLHGIRRVTKGGNTFDELSQAVANRIGTMKSKRNSDYDLVGYEYKNIDGQTALMSKENGLVLADPGLAQKVTAEAEREAAAERAAAERAAAERAEAERKAVEEASKGALAKLSGDMVPIPEKDYAMCKYEVTQALWFAVMGETPSYFKGADHPVERVSWDDCQKFLEKLNALPEVKESGVTYRLPTADEWDYACRAGATGDYCKLEDGTEITKETLGEVAWYDDNSGVETHPVGQKKPSAFGLYDMHGNVWEWSSTADGDYRIDFGGSWGSNASYCKAGCRRSNSPGRRDILLGFRLAR